MLGECSLLVRLEYRERCSFGVRCRYGGPFSHDALFRGRLSGPPYRPRALKAGSYELSVWTCDQLEYGNVGVFHPRF